MQLWNSDVGRACDGTAMTFDNTTSAVSNSVTTTSDAAVSILLKSPLAIALRMRRPESVTASCARSCASTSVSVRVGCGCAPWPACCDMGGPRALQRARTASTEVRRAPTPARLTRAALLPQVTLPTAIQKTERAAVTSWESARVGTARGKAHCEAEGVQDDAWPSCAAAPSTRKLAAQSSASAASAASFGTSSARSKHNTPAPSVGARSSGIAQPAALQPPIRLFVLKRRTALRCSSGQSHPPRPPACRCAPAPSARRDASAWRVAPA